MATALYSTMLVRPASVEAVKRYLYSPTEVVEAAPVVEYRGNDRLVGEQVALVLRTEVAGREAECVREQGQQRDRLASGMHWMRGTHDTRHDAREAAHQDVFERGYALGEFAPFVVGADA